MEIRLRLKLWCTFRLNRFDANINSGVYRLFEASLSRRLRIENVNSINSNFPQYFSFPTSESLRDTRGWAYSNCMARPDCPKCGGTGWKIVEGHREVSPASPRVPPKATRETVGAGPNTAATGRYGFVSDEPRVAVPCDCVEAERADRGRDRAHIPSRYEHCDFGNFETDVYEDFAEAESYNRDLSRGKLTLEGFAREYPVTGDTGILLTGPCGVGKTHLAVAAAKQLITRGHTVLFCDYRELLKEIQGSYNAANNATEAGVLEPVLNVEVLLLDDVGASKPSPWALETIGHILNTRYNEKRVTLLTANYLDDPRSKAASQSSAAAKGQLNASLNSAETDLSSLDAANQPSDPRDTFAARREGRPARSGRDVRTIFSLPTGESFVAPHEDSLEERIGGRIRSRLYEMCRTVEIYAPDFRKGVRNANNRPDLSAHSASSGNRSPRVHH
jgi:DNA replication protein DnaC